MKQRVHFAIELQAGAEPPREFRLFGAGPNKAHDGRGTFVFDDLSAQACMTHSAERGLDYVIDYEHASLSSFSLDPAESGKAAGWFTPEIRDGALFATNVKWTPKATEKLKAKEYRYFSPAADFEATPDGGKRITKLINCALTNNPALAGIPPLMASAMTAEPTKEKPMLKALLSMLKLPEATTEAEAIVMLSALTESHSTLLSATGAKSVDEATGLIAGWKASAEQTAKLTAELADIKKAAAAREIDELIDSAKKDGRLAPGAEKAAREVASASTAALKAMLSVLPKVGGRTEQPTEKFSTTEAFGLSAEELTNCKKLGISAEKFAAHKTASIASRTTAA